MSHTAEEQRRLILDQFTKQAVPFSEMPAHSNEESIRLFTDRAGIGPGDSVLDVACGPGLVACALARVARHVTGIDLTPAMIEQAQARQRALGLWRALSETRVRFVSGERDPAALEQTAAEELDRHGLRTDYAELRDPVELQRPAVPDESTRLFLAAFVGKTKLIDNGALGEAG